MEHEFIQVSPSTVEGQLPKEEIFAVLFTALIQVRKTMPGSPVHNSALSEQMLQSSSQVCFKNITLHFDAHLKSYICHWSFLKVYSACLGQESESNNTHLSSISFKTTCHFLGLILFQFYKETTQLKKEVFVSPC